MNPETGFQSGPGDSVDADWMASCLLVTKPSPPSGGGSEKGALKKSTPLDLPPISGDPVYSVHPCRCRVFGARACACLLLGVLIGLLGRCWVLDD